MFPIETIPDSDKVYYRVHKSYLPKGKLIPGVFKEVVDGMSTDWEKYSTAEQTQNRATKPMDNGVVSFITGDLRQKVDLTVTHSPTQNRAHTLVCGKLEKIQESTEIRLKLLGICQWEIVV